MVSTKEYVTSTAASGILHSMNPTDACCFGQLIHAIHFDGPLYRGVWAGDRFRIVTTDVFKTKIFGEEEEWEDVSVEATKWLRAILRSDRQYHGDSTDGLESRDDEDSDDGP